jgi:hypothetical protein
MFGGYKTLTLPIFGKKLSNFAINITPEILSEYLLLLNKILVTGMTITRSRYAVFSKMGRI